MSMKILVVDDHPLMLQGIKQTLIAEPDMKVVGEAKSADEALSLLRAIEIDVLILDINMSGRSGLDALPDIRKTSPMLPILMLSIHPEGAVALRAIKAGANGYLSKDAIPEELIRAVRRVHSGKSYVSPFLADLLVHEMNGHPLSLPHTKLSDKEYQVMCLLASGKGITEIAALMRLSSSTISTFRTRLLEKMNMTTNAELTRYAVHCQLID